QEVGHVQRLRPVLTASGERDWSHTSAEGGWTMSSGVNQARAEGEYFNHGIGRLGEQTVADWLGTNGYVIMYGPGRSTRPPRGSPYRVHQPTTKGLDIIAFRPSDGEILVLDNKAGIGGGSVTEVGAFSNSLRDKLSNRIDKILGARTGLPA